ncbi:MAG: putative ferric reductase [Paracoccaceae bacterium]|jgi:predicted ferric reductase
MKPAVLILLYLSVALAPLALAWTGMRPPRPIWDELASGAGMLAFAMILAEFASSGRFQSVSRRIGMDVTMRFHQLFARTALALAMVHPFLYASPFNPPLGWDATRALTLTVDIGALAGGIGAFVLLPCFVLLSINRARLGYRHEAWRLLHGLGAVAIAGMLLHHTLTAGRYAGDPALAALWIGLSVLALLSFLFVYVAKPLMKLRRPWRVKAIDQVAEQTWRLTLSPVGHDGIDYLAGQFAWVSVGRSAFSLAENPFSISSAPASGRELSFVIKELGDFTRSLPSIKPGTRAYVDGPFGHLVIDGRDAPAIVLIAGGIGIAPLIGILRQMRLTGDTRPCTLIYGNTRQSQITEGDEIASLGAEVIHVLQTPPPGWTGRTGWVTPDLIRDLFASTDRRDALFVICGPTVMMLGVENALLALGVPPVRILLERFDYD